MKIEIFTHYSVSDLETSVNKFLKKNIKVINVQYGGFGNDEEGYSVMVWYEDKEVEG